MGRRAGHRGDKRRRVAGGADPREVRQAPAAAPAAPARRRLRGRGGRHPVRGHRDDGPLLHGPRRRLYQRQDDTALSPLAAARHHRHLVPVCQAAGLVLSHYLYDADALIYWV